MRGQHGQFSVGPPPPYTEIHSRQIHPRWRRGPTFRTGGRAPLERSSNAPIGADARPIQGSEIPTKNVWARGDVVLARRKFADHLGAQMKLIRSTLPTAAPPRHRLQPPRPTLRPSQAVAPAEGGYQASYQAEFSHSFDSQLNRGETSLGDFNASLFSLDYSAYRAHQRHVYLGTWRGLGLRSFRCAGRRARDRSRCVRPTQQPLGLRRSNGVVRTDIRPGIYSDFEDIGGDDVNVPFTAILAYEYSPTLTLVAGLNVNYQA
jgi:hypothetical protein